MIKDKSLMDGSQSELRGVFVETAFTNDQVARANADEMRVATDIAECAFLGTCVDDGAVSASLGNK